MPETFGPLGSTGISKTSFTTKILIAMAVGIAFGSFLNIFGAGLQPVSGFVVGSLQGVGQIFIRLLQMMVVPLILVSLVCGVTALGDVKALGRVGLKTMALYLCTTAIAIVLAMTVATLLSPGAGFVMDVDVVFQATEAPPLRQVVIDMFPVNPVRALAEGQTLQIIVFAIFLGFALTQSGVAGARLASLFEDANDIIMRMVLFIVRTAPIGVFALIASTFAEQGFEVFGQLVRYFFTVVLVLVLHVLITYTSIVRLAGLKTILFLKKMRAVMTFAFSTSSSSATIPVTLNTLERRLGVDNSVASFTVPLGATINMDGTAIMQGVATVFIANVYGIDLTLANYLTVILTATLASIGTAAVPGAGIVMLTMVLTQIGLPVDGIGLILGVDRLLDMMRTAVNVCGDSAVTCFVAKTENKIDMDVFEDPEITLESAASEDDAAEFEQRKGT